MISRVITNTYVTSELGSHRTDTTSPINNDQRLLFLRATKGDKAEMTMEHLPGGETDQGERSSLGVAPPGGLASGDAGVDDGVLAV